MKCDELLEKKLQRIQNETQHEILKGINEDSKWWISRFMSSSIHVNHWRLQLIDEGGGLMCDELNILVVRINYNWNSLG